MASDEIAITRTVSNLSDGELIKMINAPAQSYTAFALDVAKKEIEKRGGLEAAKERIAIRKQQEAKQEEEKRKEEERVPEEKKTKVAQGMFKPADYFPFMGGVFIIGGLLLFPFSYGLILGMRYLDALPWSVASCVVFLISIRRSGQISLGRTIVSIIALTVAAQDYANSTGKPAFAVGGFLGVIGLTLCGYFGVGIGKLIRRFT